MPRIFIIFILSLLISTTAYSNSLDDEAKKLGFRNWSELSNIVRKCNSLMLSGFPKMRLNCKSGDLDCIMKQTDIQVKKFNSHYDKVIASNRWKNLKCKTWMLGGGSRKNKVEELEERIEELEQELESLQN